MAHSYGILKAVDSGTLPKWSMLTFFFFFFLNQIVNLSAFEMLCSVQIPELYW